MFIVAALILLLAGPWFDSQQTVGYILLIPAAFEVLVYLINIGLFVSIFKDSPARRKW